MVFHLQALFDRTPFKDDNASSSLQIAFMVGLDPTALVMSWQISSSYKAIVGGSSPNHYISIKGMFEYDVTFLLHECVEGRKGQVATEVIVCIMSMQNTPLGLSPYCVLSGLSQTINENNAFGTVMCNAATQKNSNAVVLNALSYLDCKSNQISFPDTNHNVKNNRYQLSGGSLVVSIGYYAFDPWLLKMA